MALKPLGLLSILYRPTHYLIVKDLAACKRRKLSKPQFLVNIFSNFFRKNCGAGFKEQHLLFFEECLNLPESFGKERLAAATLCPVRRKKRFYGNTSVLSTTNFCFLKKF